MVRFILCLFGLLLAGSLTGSAVAGRGVNDPTASASARFSVTVEGQVYTQGTFEMEPGATLADVLVKAGGVTRLARRNQAVLIRGQGGNLVIWLVDLTNERHLAHQLREGDRLFVELRAY